VTYAATAYRLFGRWTEAQCAKSPDLQTRLHKAHMFTKDSTFLASLYLTSAIAAIVALALAVGPFLVLQAPLVIRIVVPLLASLTVGVSAYLVGHVIVANRAVEVAKSIDENLPAALNYLLALANAGMTPRQIWRSLAERKVFGALAIEAERITRDLDVFACDILTALRNAEVRTPSQRFHEFLQGAISSFQSGVDLQTYLKAKGQQYQDASIQTQRQVLDTMGVMAEAFLVVVVATPLFLIILITVMAINKGQSVILFGYLLTFLFIPFAQVIIGAMIQSMNPARED
jgi:flagellar protein FlaJ